MTEHLHEHTVASEQMYDGKLLKVFRDTVKLPNGTETVREYIKHPGAVVVVAMLDNGKILFEHQYRYPHRKVFLELPAGKIDPGEDILACARRELREETGHEAADWVHLGVMHPCIGYSDERIEMFLARRLDYVGAELDHEEFLEVTSLPLEGALASVMAGQITDAKTITALLWAERVVRLGK